MFSPRESHQVLADLGDKFPTALLRATNASRTDLETFRREHPDWIPTMFERDLANFVHPRIWDHLKAELIDLPGINFTEREPYREIGIQTVNGRGYVARVKKHNVGDRISSYSTSGDLVFWSGRQEALDGLERITLAVGYRWNRDTRQIESPVISYREGKDRPVWAVAVDEGQAGGLPFGYQPILPPNLPRIDLLDATREEHDEGQAQTP